MLEPLRGQPYSTYLWLCGDWHKWGCPEVNHLRDVLMLFKWSLDMPPSVESMAREGPLKESWSASGGAVYPRHVLPGFWTIKEGGGEREPTIFHMWLGRSVYQQTEDIFALPLRAVQVAMQRRKPRACSSSFACLLILCSLILCSIPRAVQLPGGVEELRVALGMQCQLQQHMTTREGREAEDREIDRNLQKVHAMVDVAIGEDEVLLNTKLPLTVDARGSIHAGTQTMDSLLVASC